LRPDTVLSVVVFPAPLAPRRVTTVCGTPPDLLGVIHDGKLTAVAGIGPETHYLSSILSYGQVDIYKKYWDQYSYPKFPSDQESVIHTQIWGFRGMIKAQMEEIPVEFTYENVVKWLDGYFKAFNKNAGPLEKVPNMKKYFSPNLEFWSL
jgi:hypothetical protein